MAAVLIAVGFVAVGALELSLWPKRPFKKTAIYLLLLVAMGALAVAVALDIDLPVPSPIDALLDLFKSLQGVGMNG